VLGPVGVLFLYPVSRAARSDEAPSLSASVPAGLRFYALSVGLLVATDSRTTVSSRSICFYALSVGLLVATRPHQDPPGRPGGFYALSVELLVATPSYYLTHETPAGPFLCPVSRAARRVLSETRAITPLTCGDAGSEPSFR